MTSLRFGAFLLLGQIGLTAWADNGPALAMNDPILRREVCGGHPCTLELVGTVAAGASQVSIVRWPLCDAPGEKAPDAVREAHEQQQADGDCPIGYFRVVHAQGRITEVRHVVAEGNFGSRGYGPNGGEEAVEFDAEAGTLAHTVNGGGSMRWNHGETWRVAPDFRLLESSEGSGTRENWEWTREARWRQDDQVTLGAATYTACRLNPKTRTWERAADPEDSRSPETLLAKFGAVPRLATPLYWRRDPLPDWLEMRADAKPGPRRHSVVLTKTQADASPARMRLLWLNDESLLIELDGVRPVAAAAGPTPRIEAWWWDHAVDGMRECVLPPLAARKGKVPDSGRDVQVADAVYQVLIGVDGVVTSAFGGPLPEQLQVERAKLGDAIRLRLAWKWNCESWQQPCRQPYAIALSMSVGKRQHLVSHTDLRFADPTSFALPITADLPSAGQSNANDWKEAVTKHFDQAPKPRQ